jgi:hypothetical protein
MRLRLRSLMIVLALGLVLLRFGLRMLPEKLNLPGGMLTWLLLVSIYHYVIPFGVISTLAAAVIIHLLPDAKSGRQKSN